MDTTVDLRERVRQQARETYRQSLAAEMPLNGRQLGEMFERSERWGRDRITEVRRQDDLEETGGHGPERGERQPEPSRQADVPPDAADRTAATPPTPPTAARAGTASPTRPPAQPRPPNRPPVSDDPDRTTTALPTAQPMPRPGLGPWIAPASRTVSASRTAPENGTRQISPTTAPTTAPAGTPAAAPAAASPGVSKAIRRTTIAAVMVVAAVAAVVSFAHMHDLARKAGEGWRAWLLPLAVDGLIIAASMTMLVRRRQGRTGGVLAWSSLILGIAASLAANVAAAAPTWEGRVVAAWPPIALLLSYELLMQQVRDTRTP